MKKTKIIIPALGMLLLSTAASVTGTVAWFSMNNFVTATGMSVNAKAENGIVISNSKTSTTWTDTTSATNGSAIAVYPVSTFDATTWAHSASNNANSSASSGTYTMLTTAVSAGKGYVDEGTAGYDANDPLYYQVNSFFIKSSADGVINNLYVTHVKATVSAAEDPSTDLNKSLRVLVKANNTAKIYSPLYDSTQEVGDVKPLQYTVTKSVNANGTADQTQPVTSINSNTTNGLVASANQLFLENATIPAFKTTNNDALQVDVYVYFEGEDINCKSANLKATMDTLTIDVQFGLVTATA